MTSISNTVPCTGVITFLLCNHCVGHALVHGSKFTMNLNLEIHICMHQSNPTLQKLHSETNQWSVTLLRKCVLYWNSIQFNETIEKKCSSGIQLLHTSFIREWECSLQLN